MVPSLVSLKEQHTGLLEKVSSIHINKSACVCHLISCVVLFILSIVTATLGGLFLTNCIILASPAMVYIVSIACFVIALALLSCLLLRAMEYHFNKIQMNQVRSLVLNFHFLASGYACLVKDGGRC